MTTYPGRRAVIATAAMALMGFTALAAAAPAQAASVTLTAKMIPVPGAPPTGLGYVTAQYDPATLTLSWNITYSGLTGPLTAAHFHGPATPGVDAPPVVPIPPPLENPINGSAKLTLDQVSQMLGGLFYVNLHTQAFPNGEIRGQLNVQP